LHKEDVTMLARFEFVVPLPPVTKKNSQQIIKIGGRPMIIPSKQYKQYEKDCYPFFKGLNDEDFPIDYAVNIECRFYMPTRRRTDLTNLLEAIDDIMVRCGVLEDDNYHIIESHDGSRVFYDHDNPRTEIVITQIEE